MTGTVRAEDAGDDVLFERRGALGLITLNRPKALNALTHAMVLAMERRLDLWRDDAGVAVVAIQGSGEKAFCAGGDIRALYEAGRPGGAAGRANFRFYADEYRLNWKIKTYPKPYVSLMDGIVMGGGVGVSIHGSHRIATERTVFAMPETGIGLFPDVGATWFLPRAPGETGMWLGLTGARLKAVDALRADLCSDFMPAERLGQLIDALARDEPGAEDAHARVGWVIGALERVPEMPSVIDEHRERIDRCFGGESLRAVLAALAAEEHYWAGEQRAAIAGKSPLCSALAFRQIRAGAALSFEECMALEYRLARFCMTHGDFYEGVRAAIIDKDGAPDWSPATLDEVDDAVLEAAVAPLGDEELVLG